MEQSYVTLARKHTLNPHQKSTAGRVVQKYREHWRITRRLLTPELLIIVPEHCIQVQMKSDIKRYEINTKIKHNTRRMAQHTSTPTLTEAEWYSRIGPMQGNRNGDTTRRGRDVAMARSSAARAARLSNHQSCRLVLATAAVEPSKRSTEASKRAARHPA